MKNIKIIGLYGTSHLRNLKVYYFQRHRNNKIILMSLKKKEGGHYVIENLYFKNYEQYAGGKKR